jgi:hypothetical protein
MKNKKPTSKEGAFLIINYQILTVNCQLSTVNCQLPTANCQLRLFHIHKKRSQFFCILRFHFSAEDQSQLAAAQGSVK